MGRIKLGENAMLMKWRPEDGIICVKRDPNKEGVNP
jgi:hypothetical protein